MTKHKTKTTKAEMFKLGRLFVSSTATATEAARHAAPRQLATRIAANLQHVEADAEELMFRLHALGEIEKADAVEALLGIVRSLVNKGSSALILSCHQVAESYAASMKSPNESA